MKKFFNEQGDSHFLIENLSQLANNSNVKGVLIIACDANNFTPTEIDPILQNFSKPVFGGIFPEIIFNQNKYQKGTIIVGIEDNINTYILPSLSDPEIDFENVIDKNIPADQSFKTMVVMFDGFAKRITAFVDSLFTVFGLEQNYIGGGAGSLSFQQKPCIFTNQGFLEDSAVLALLDTESGIGVSHGWEEISGPYKATETDQNVIKTIDWKPAFKVYKEIVEKHSGKKFTNENFFEISKAYPFGINKLGAEKIVRDPVSNNKDESLTCVGEIPESSFIYIMHGNQDSLIKAAGKANQIALESYNSQKPYFNFFIDCISRVLFLQDAFYKEIAAVHQSDVDIIGALTIGEIANNGKDYLEFYNKTSVVGILAEK